MLLEIKRLLKENQIFIDLHNFQWKEAEISFYLLNNREVNIEKSGIKSIETLLKNKFIEIENVISPTLKHNFVYSTLQTINVENEFLNNGRPFLDFKDFFGMLNNGKYGKIFDENKLRKILTDLHKLGVLVYFNNDSLRDTIVYNPKCFNKVFKTLTDYGRKKTENIFEKLFDSIEGDEKNGNYLFSKTKNNAKQQLESILKELKSKANPKLKINEIWEKERNISIVDRISFENLLKNLEKIRKVLQKENNEKYLDNLKEDNVDITQSIYTANEYDFKYSILEEILGSEDSKEIDSKFLVDFLVKFEFILPKTRIHFFNKDKQSYIIPFLFPENKPTEIILKSGEKLKTVERNFEWTIEYQLSFKPSSMWKVKKFFYSI